MKSFIQSLFLKKERNILSYEIFNPSSKQDPIYMKKIWEIRIIFILIILNIIVYTFYFELINFIFS